MQKSHEIEFPHLLMIAIIKQSKTNLVTNTCWQGYRGRQKKSCWWEHQDDMVAMETL